MHVILSLEGRFMNSHFSHLIYRQYFIGYLCLCLGSCLIWYSYLPICWRYSKSRNATAWWCGLTRLNSFNSVWHYIFRRVMYRFFFWQSIYYNLCLTLLFPVRQDANKSKSYTINIKIKMKLCLIVSLPDLEIWNICIYI